MLQIRARWLQPALSQCVLLESPLGWTVGFDYEEELVQVSLLGGEFAQISMAQNSGDESGGIDWHRGDGPDPLLVVVGKDAMATGTLESHPGSENALAGTFVMAANCSITQREDRVFQYPGLRRLCAIARTKIRLSCRA